MLEYSQAINTITSRNTYVMEEDKMKKCIAILLIATLCLGIVACSGKTEEVESDKGLVGFCSVSLSESIYVLEQKAL